MGTSARYGAEHVPLCAGGLLGVLIALFGAFNQVLRLVAIGAVRILADFAWFARFQTSGPLQTRGRQHMSPAVDATRQTVRAR